MTSWRSYRSFAATQWPWEQNGTSFCKPWEYSVGQLLKQRWLEGLQTVGSLSKYNSDKICTCITLFVRGRCCTATAWNVSSFREEVNSRLQFSFLFFFLTNPSLEFFFHRNRHHLKNWTRWKAMWLSIHSHMLV